MRNPGIEDFSSISSQDSKGIHTKENPFKNENENPGMKDFSLISQSVGAEGMRSGSSAKSIIRLSTSTGKGSPFLRRPDHV